MKLNNHGPMGKLYNHKSLPEGVKPEADNSKVIWFLALTLIASTVIISASIKYKTNISVKNNSEKISDDNPDLSNNQVENTAMQNLN